VNKGDDLANDIASTGSGLDCGHGHTSCCTLPALAASPQPPASASQPVTPVEGILRTLAQALPERPQWVRFA
jgi:hypothetical protein